MIDNHTDYIIKTSNSILQSAEHILIYLRIANSIYPQCYEELAERRINQDRALGLCFAILSKYQIAMQILEVNDEKYSEVIDNLEHEINSIKKWRESDNRFKKAFSKNKDK